MKRAIIYKEVIIYTPISTLSYPRFFGKISSILKELEKLSGQVKVKSGGQDVSPLEIKYLYFKDPTIKRLFPPRIYKFIRKKFYHKHFIRFKSRLTINDIEEFGEKEDVYYSFEEEVKSYVRMLIAYLNLAKPGGFRTVDGKILITEKLSRIEKKQEKFEPVLSLIEEALEFTAKWRWPPIKELEIKTVIDFVHNHWNEIQKIPTNRIQRALNAFSYLFHESLVEDNANDLFYSVLGIEALFVSGHDNIQKQVDIKTQILFGERMDFKKRFNELYNFRSRYIHGQLNIVNHFFPYSLDIESRYKQLSPLYENTCFAMMILLASIQRHIELNKTELEFEYNLKQ